MLDGAVVGCDCNIGDHVFIEGGAHIGDRVTIKNQVMIWDGITIEDDAFIGPGVIFTNDRHPRGRVVPGAAKRYERRENWLVPTLVKRGASLGAGAVILPGMSIGRFASVGAGAVVTRSVSDQRLAVGNPAKDVGWVCVCGVPLYDSTKCPQCDRCISHDNSKRESSVEHYV